MDLTPVNLTLVRLTLVSLTRRLKFIIIEMKEDNLKINYYSNKKKHFFSVSK